jgi:hypothetical protein
MAGTLSRAEFALDPPLYQPDSRPSARGVMTSLREVLAGTGTGQIGAIEASATPTSAWLCTMLDEARASDQEAERLYLPEQVLDFVEENSPEMLDEADIRFFATQVISIETPVWEALASTSVLAALAEDNLVPRDVMITTLRGALQLRDPARRLAAVEGLCQCDATEVVWALEILLQTESHPDIVATTKHALRILRRGERDTPV